MMIMFLKNKKDQKTSENIINTAKKDAEKIKRDSLFETKEEIHKLKSLLDSFLGNSKKELDDWAKGAKIFGYEFKGFYPNNEFNSEDEMDEVLSSGFKGKDPANSAAAE